MVARAAGALSLALALMIPAVRAQDASVTWGRDYGFALSAPEGWTLARDIKGSGVSLRSPGRAELVELAFWPVSVGVTNAESVAAEHERILAGKVAYTRSDMQALETAGAGEGVYVTGLVKLADGTDVGSAFAAFLRDGVGYVIGVFVPPNALPDAREELIEPVLARFSLTGRLAGPPIAVPEPDPEPVTPEPVAPEPDPVTQPPEPIVEPDPEPDPVTPDPVEPAPVVEPDPEPEPMTPDPVDPVPVIEPDPEPEYSTEPGLNGPQVETSQSPELVAVAPDDADPKTGAAAGGEQLPDRYAPDQWDLYTHPLGFSMRLPRGWQCSVTEGAILAADQTGMRVYLLPLVGTVEVADSETAITYVRQALSSDVVVRSVECDACVGERGVVWVSVRASIAGREAQGLFALAQGPGTALLAGGIAPGSMGRELPLMVSGITSTFQARFATPDQAESVSPTVEWRDASRALKCQAPVGWRLSGGVQPFDETATIQIKATRDDGRAWFVWSQPVRPMLRELTEAMHRLGFRNGDPYYAYDGIDARMVMSRGTGADLLNAYLLPDGIVPMPAGSTLGEPVGLGNTGLLGHAGEQSALIEVSPAGGANGARGTCVVSQGTIEGSRGGWFWEAGCLAYGGDPDALDEASSALRDTIHSAKTTTVQVARLQDLIARATRVASASFWPSGARKSTVQRALEVVSDEGRTYIVPVAAGRVWAEVADGSLQPCGAVASSTSN